MIHNFFKIIIGLLIAQNLSFGRDNEQLSVAHGLASIQGRRPTMEDDHAVKIPFLKDDPFSYFFAIYDGHGGPDIARFCAKNVHKMVAKVYSSSPDMSKALIEGIESADRELDQSDLKFKAQSSGSTAAIAIVKDGSLHVAHAGDARVILCRNGLAIPLTEDHKPNNRIERKRIEQAGGKVFTYGVPRVGGLAVSRAIGDHALRPLGVIATPDAKNITIEDSDAFVLLACDGIFEPNISCQEAIDVVQESLEKNKGNPEAAHIAANDLTEYAYARGSGDNLSALVLVFNKKVRSQEIHAESEPAQDQTIIE